jgi:hypothetical protein
MRSLTPPYAHRSLREAEQYTRAADQARSADAAMVKIP